MKTKREIDVKLTGFKRMIDFGKFKLVPEQTKFIFHGICPYCKGDITYSVIEWIEDEEGLKMANDIEGHCSNEPDVSVCDKKWDDWFKVHTVMWYVRQLPINEKVKEYINLKYRFYED